MQNTLNFAGNVAGLDFARHEVAITSDGGAFADIALPAAATGTLSTRTGNDEGVLTVGSGHGIIVGDEIAVFWSGGWRYNMTVSAQDATTITFGGIGGPGLGDNLPAQATAITVGKQVAANLPFEGTNLVMLIAQSRANPPQRAGVIFFDAGGIELAVDLNSGNGYQHALLPDSGVKDAAGTDIVNPLAGDSILTIQAANGYATAQNVAVAAAYDATP